MLAVVTLVMIHSGENIATSRRFTTHYPGLLLMWSGNLMLLAVVAWLYIKVKRH